MAVLLRLPHLRLHASLAAPNPRPHLQQHGLTQWHNFQLAAAGAIHHGSLPGQPPGPAEPQPHVQAPLPAPLPTPATPPRSDDLFGAFSPSGQRATLLRAAAAAWMLAVAAAGMFPLLLLHETAEKGCYAVRAMRSWSPRGVPRSPPPQGSNPDSPPLGFFTRSPSSWKTLTLLFLMLLLSSCALLLYLLFGSRSDPLLLQVAAVTLVQMVCYSLAVLALRPRTKKGDESGVKKNRAGNRGVATDAGGGNPPLNTAAGAATTTTTTSSSSSGRATLDGVAAAATPAALPTSTGGSRAQVQHTSNSDSHTPAAAVKAVAGKAGAGNATGRPLILLWRLLMLLSSMCAWVRLWLLGLLLFTRSTRGCGSSSSWLQHGLVGMALVALALGAVGDVLFSWNVYYDMAG